MTRTLTSSLQLILLAALCSGFGCARTSASTNSKLLVSGVNGQSMSLAQLHSALETARHIYVAEEHESQSDHWVQLQVLQEVKALGKEIVLGIEWLPTNLQPALDQWQLGPGDQDSFLGLIAWEKAWGFDLKLYWPIISWAHQHKVPIVALNAPRNIVFGFSKHGKDGLTPEQRSLLPPLNSGNAIHRAYFVYMMRKAAEAMGGHGHHSGFEKHIDAYYQAQLIWDETMASAVTTFLQTPSHQMKTMIILAGRGHIDFGLGIPERVRTPTGEDYLIVTPANDTYPATTESQEHQAGWPGPRAHLFWLSPKSH